MSLPFAEKWAKKWNGHGMGENMNGKQMVAEQKMNRSRKETGILLTGNCVALCV